MEGLLQGLTRGLDASHVIRRERGPDIGYLRLQFALLFRGDFVTQFSDTLFRTISCAIGQVAFLDLFLAPLVVGSMRLSVTHHAINLVLREAARSNNGDLLLTPGALVTCRDIHNAVGIDVKCDLDLRHTTRSGRNTIQNKAAQRTIVLSEFALTLQDVDFYARLAIAGR